VKIRIWRLAALMLLSLAAAAFAASPASAGSQVVTGDDEHCNEEERGENNSNELFCQTTRAYIDYARGGAPDPGRGLLVIDCDGEAEYVEGAYEEDPEMTIVCPDDGEVIDRGQAPPSYEEIEFTTAQFSAIIVGEGEASDNDLETRADDFQRFFDQGGGIATFNSSDGGDRGGRGEGGGSGDYDFLPLPVESSDESVNGPYTVTDVGRERLGIADEQVNADCCQHESFEDPSGDSPMKVAVRAASEEAEQNFREGDSMRGAAPADPGPAIVLIGRTEPEEDDDRGPNPEDNFNGPEPVQEQSQQLPDPLSFVSLFGNVRSATVNANGGFMVPGMTETCGVGPCNVYERGFIPKPGAQAASHANHKRHGLLGQDRDVLAAGQSNAVRMRLNRLGRRKLAKAGRLRIETMVTVTDAKGRSQLVKKTITLRPKG
jgi:hypothetical protein